MKKAIEKVIHQLLVFGVFLVSTAWGAQNSSVIQKELHIRVKEFSIAGPLSKRNPELFDESLEAARKTLKNATFVLSETQDAALVRSYFDLALLLEKFDLTNWIGEELLNFEKANKKFFHSALKKLKKNERARLIEAMKVAANEGRDDDR